MTEEIAEEIEWREGIKSLSHIVKGRDLMDGMEKIYMNGEDSGISTSWPSLDEHYTVKSGEMCVVTGVPTHGKSEFLDALTVNLAISQGWKFLFFSPENQPYERHGRKLIEKYVGKSLRREFHGEITKMPVKEFGTGIQFIDKHFSWMDIKNAQISIDKILEVFCHMADYHGIRGFVLDPWNEVEHRRPKDYSETEYISLCLSVFREFARAKDVALWIVAHPAKMLRGKDGVYPVPSLWDISGSAHWRSKADNGIVVHRPDIHENMVDIHVQKVRFKSTGKPGVVPFIYDWWSGRFKEDTNTQRVKGGRNA